MVVNSNGRAYTQRVEPKLALVEVELPTDAFNEDWEPTDSSYLGKYVTDTHVNIPKLDLVWYVSDIYALVRLFT